MEPTDLVKSGGGQLVISVELEELYKVFHQKYGEAIKAEVNVLSELGKDDYVFDILRTYWETIKKKRSESAQQDTTEPQDELKPLSQIFPTIFEGVSERHRTNKN